MTEVTNENISWMELSGLPFYWLESLKGSAGIPTILFLHGFPDNAFVWQKQIHALSGKAVIYAPFTWGTFKSWKYKPKHYALSYQVEALEEFIRLKEIDTENLIIVGHDMGGPIAYELSQLIGPIKKLILINSLSYHQFLSRFKDIDQILRSSYMILFQNPLINKTTLAPVHKLLLNKAYDFGGLDKDDPMRKSGPEVFVGIEQYRQFTRELPRKLLKKPPKLASESLIIWGENDPFLKTPTEEELSKHYENFKLTLLDGKHWLQRSHYEKINSIIEEVIESE